MTANLPNSAGLASAPYHSLTRFVIEGTWRFSLVSLGGFSVWAFAGRWFYRYWGEAGLYAATTLVFVGLAGLLLHPLVSGPRRLWRFWRVFVPAFLAYAVCWCLFWFALGGGLGEWLGSLAGSLALVAVTSWGLGNGQRFVSSSIAFFLAHSAGYFAGGLLMAWVLEAHHSGWLAGISKDLVGLIGKLSWGLAYGIGFGAGLGYTFHACQRCPDRPSDVASA